MKKHATLFLGLCIVFGFMLSNSCGGGKEAQPSSDKEKAAASTKGAAKKKEQIARLVQDKMKKMQDKIKAMDDRAAISLAQKEAKKWDGKAKLYSLEGEDSLKPDVTAKQWTAYFAVTEDSDDTPGREHGKKFVVLMLGGKIVSAEKKETPEDISYTKDCYGFLPDNRMSGKEAFDKCLTALKDKYGDKADVSTAKRIECLAKQFYIPPNWITKPTWRLTLEIDGSPISAAIHAQTGEVLEVK